MTRTAWTDVGQGSHRRRPCSDLFTVIAQPYLDRVCRRAGVLPRPDQLSQVQAAGGFQHPGPKRPSTPERGTSATTYELYGDGGTRLNKAMGIATWNARRAVEHQLPRIQ